MFLLPDPNEIVVGLVNIGGVYRVYPAVLLRVPDDLLFWKKEHASAEEHTEFASAVSWHSALMGTRIPRVVGWLYLGKPPKAPEQLAGFRLLLEN